MTFYKNKPRRNPNAPKAHDALAHPSTNISKVTYELLQEMARVRKIPVPKLIAYAIDNEFDSPSPFTYDYSTPDEEYEEGKYHDASYKIFKYLTDGNFPNGTGKDMLLLCRRDMGIETKTEFLLGYRELLEKEQIEEVPVKSMFYSKDHLWVSLRKDLLPKKKRAYKEIKPMRGPLDDIDQNDPE